MKDKDNILDAMAIISFFIGIANYNENLGQTGAQKLLDDALSNIHSHLREQDKKIDELLERVK